MLRNNTNFNIMEDDHIHEHVLHYKCDNFELQWLHLSSWKATLEIESSYVEIEGINSKMST